MIKCVIIDDEQAAINVLKKYICQLPNLELVGTATNPLEGISIVQQTKAELVFLDIHMDEMNGLDVMNILGTSVQVIFCTAFSEFALASYEFNAVDYLLKPFSFSRFVKAVSRIKTLDIAIKETNQLTDDYMFVKTEHKGRIIKIDFVDLYYVEAKNNYVAFHNGNMQILVYSTMSEIEGFLPENQFIRIHRSYIVAFSKISFIENHYLHFKNIDDKIPIGKNYWQNFTDSMKDKFLGK